MKEQTLPLAEQRDRAILYGGALLLLCLAQIRLVAAQKYGDWTAFWSAGWTAGTGQLLNPHRHADWQHAHHLDMTPFVYLPGTAWAFLPFRHVSIPAGYAINAALMLALLVWAGVIAARVYALPKWFSVLAVLAWAPAIAGVATGQISPLGLLLTLAFIAALTRGSPFAAGFAAGALLYKPPYAIPLLVLLLARREWRALAVSAVCAALWYALSVAATAGDFSWPAHYVATLQSYFAPDFAYNGAKAVSIPGLLLRAHAPVWLATGAGAAILVAGAVLTARRPVLEAASIMPLVGLLANPHTWPYDVVLALPALFFLMTHAPPDRRMWIVYGSYIIAPLWFFSFVFHFDVLAIVCVAIAAYWLVK